MRVGISGFGAIGRRVLRIAQKRSDVEVVAINGPGATSMMAHLFQFDSNYGVYDGTVSIADDHLVVDGRPIRVFHEREPQNIDWSSQGVEVVIESSGKFTDPTLAAKHLEGGARRVVISAPAKGDAPTFVLGVNEGDYDPAVHRVMSMGSCTTNCLLPVMKVLDREFSVVEGMLTTVHSYTGEQSILDRSHRDIRRARAAAMNIVPTSTGAQKAIKVVWPELAEHFHGISLRVPTPVVSAIDLVVRLSRPTSAQAINDALRSASESDLRGILGYTEVPLVSSDFRGSPLSGIVDGLLTASVGELCKVMAWYDNEWGYAARIVDFAAYLGGRETQ